MIVFKRGRVHSASGLNCLSIGALCSKVSIPLLLLSLLTLYPVLSFGSDKVYKKDQVHAVFLYNLTRFVRWPDTAFNSKQSPHKICVIGKTPIVGLLKKVVKGESTNGRYYTVERTEAIQSSLDCHILFFTSVSARIHSDDIGLLKNLPVLLVSPQSNFTEEYGMLSLGQKGNRVQPIINIKNVNSSKIKISSKLLQLATIVGNK